LLDGRLFTRDFLLEGIKETDAWRTVDEAVYADFKQNADRLARNLAARKSPNEAQTEDDLVYPLLELLGWADRDVQANASVKARLDVPDALLYPSAEAKRVAGSLDEWKRFQHGACVVEAKRWNRPLDREEKGRKGEEGTPSSQMLRYLRRVDDRTTGKLRWGILTNGRAWRLYFHGAASVAEDFFEIDLGKVLQIEGCEPDLLDKAPDIFADEAVWRDHLLRLLFVIFQRAAFLPQAQGDSFHALALQEGQRWELKVAKSLSDKVFRDVFPALSQALAKADTSRPPVLDTNYLDQVRNGALILLYRLLFVLYAEDRNLLPDESGPYAPYCLTRIRLEIAKNLAAGTSYPKGVVSLWPRLTTIFRAISDGNDDLGIPPYNGGLFDRAAAPILERSQLADNDLSAIIFALSHEQEGEAGRGPRYINYRDLSVQQLGSVYERLLEFQLKQEAGEVSVVLNAFGRKSSGSYYTPDELVKLIITRTVGPLVDEADQAFRKEAEKAKKLDYLEILDPAQAILNLKVCDPAMGSGHFLVTLVDWMTDRVLEAMATAELLVPGYVSPVAARIDDIRTRILAQAKEHKWPIVESQLDNRQVVRRMVLKRCVYGVDLNPMAVELAKVALWLHSFTVGAPLSFLDHHLICGNALFGERVRPVMDWAQSGNLLINDLTQRARGSVRGMQQVEELTDADIAEAQSSKSLFNDVKAVTHDLRTFMDLVHGVRWADTGGRVKSRAVNRLQRGDFGNPIELLSGDTPPPAVSKAQHRLLSGKFDGPKASATEKKALADAEDRAAVPAILEDVRAALGRERFLHWEVAFPGVWSDWESNEPKGGFDAVIGNPPWDKIRFEAVKWFEARNRPDIARAESSIERDRLIALEVEGGGILADDYANALARAESSARVARDSGTYPTLSGGDVNLYALFVERALSLVKPMGMVGLLTQSGIACDLPYAKFFSSIATAGRLSCLYDFENRRGELEPFFPDVHSSQKFCTIVLGGRARTFNAANCAFFLQSTSTLDDADKTFRLTPKDFAQVNPNTGTAPMFRVARDAEITAGIYDRLPVLVNRSSGNEVAIYPIKYATMFHLTGDRKQFEPLPILQQTAYPVGTGRWRRGAEEFVPLYEGKMLQSYNHRAAGVTINPDNLHRPAQPETASAEQLANPAWFPNPQYFVSAGSLDWPSGQPVILAFKDITASTNVRTMIASLLPLSGAGHTVQLIMPNLKDATKAARARLLNAYQSALPLLIANFNSVPFDYVARQKIQHQHLTWYIVEQLPVVPPRSYERRFGAKAAAEIVGEEVLALTYTANDMAPFAEAQGYVDTATGKAKTAFTFDEKDRLRRRAKLDALYFMLYFPSATAAEIAELRDTVNYIYSTFPIVKREEEAAHNGRYLSRELCLHYINALAAGDPDAVIEV
jgi:hypothetical protein